VFSLGRYFLGKHLLGDLFLVEGNVLGSGLLDRGLIVIFGAGVFGFVRTNDNEVVCNWLIVL